MTRLYSAASVGKVCLKEMGVRPLLEKEPTFSPEILGYAMSSYYGGRAEVKIRKVDAPVAIVDFTSMYPSCFLLLDLQRLLPARRIRPVVATASVKAFVDRVTMEDLFSPEAWHQLACIVKVKPDFDLLPLRCSLDGDETWQIAMAHFESDQPMWYTLADVIAAKVQTGKAPEILEAIRFEPVGRQTGLKPIRFRGQVTIDPADQIFKTIVEERAKSKSRPNDDFEAKRLTSALKILANSAAYGVFAEINTSPPPQAGAVSGTVFGSTQYQCGDMHDEQPGPFANPILATLVTGAARLLLGMLEASVREAGGSHVFCDTDSLAIVRHDDQPLGIPSIDHAGVERILAKFNRLNPYDKSLIPDLLKLERQTRCWAVSAKHG